MDLEAPATDPLDFSLESGNSPIYIQDPPVPPHARRLPFPFTSDESSRICLHAAFNVVVLLNDLPHPSPPGETSESDASLSLRQLEIPRTMPTLICCAMQSGYAMLMLCVKARALRQYGEESSRLSAASLAGFRDELHQSLRGVVRCLDNYAIAYEALHGVRGQCRPLSILRVLNPTRADRCRRDLARHRSRIPPLIDARWLGVASASLVCSCIWMLDAPHDGIR